MTSQAVTQRRCRPIRGAFSEAGPRINHDDRALTRTPAMIIGVRSEPVSDADIEPLMTPPPEPFACSTCGARYKLVRAEAGGVATASRQVM
jgi:hypothetical protein